MEKINLYKFIWNFAKLRKLDCFMWIFWEIANDMVGVFVAQYFNKKMISYFEIENPALKVGLFFAILYIFFNNITNLFKPLKIKTKFKFIDYIAKSVRNTLFSYTIQHSMDYFNNSFAGSLNSKINIAVRSVGEILDNTKKLLCSIAIFIFVPFFYAQINIYIGIAFCLSLFVYMFMLSKIQKKFIGNKKDKAESESKYFGLINDEFTNISNIKIFSNQLIERRNIKKQNLEILRKEYRLTKTQILFQSINFVCCFLLFFSTFGIAGYLLALREISIADFTYIVIITSISRFVIIGTIKALIKIFGSIGELQNALETIYKPIGIKNKEKAEKLVANEGKIVFKNVRFGYEK
ncbi:MAG TPA: ABC transporter ATP-binding protein [Rickettsiales bacterium]|nr:ABC transporter ATP-binding protein [Rickettsiales bacterium]